MYTDEQLTKYYWDIHQSGDIPLNHIQYISKLSETFNFTPTVIYDIGSAVLHWTKHAKELWPNSTIITFEALREVETFYKQYGANYNIGVFSDTDEKEIIFYEHPLYLGGNSYYRENPQFSPASEKIYDADHMSHRHTSRIDTVAKKNNLPLPDLIKIDVQGAELDILVGMGDILKNVKHLIVELQHVEYNIGAKQVIESLPIIESYGFSLVPTSLIFPENKNKYFCGNGPDADYHFIRE